MPSPKKSWGKKYVKTVLIYDTTLEMEPSEKVFLSRWLTSRILCKNLDDLAFITLRAVAPVPTLRCEFFAQFAIIPEELPDCSYRFPHGGPGRVPRKMPICKP
jgi:hypothetical protein